MSEADKELHFPTVEYFLNSIADWVNRYRASSGSGLGECDPAEVSRIAKDLGVSSDKLYEFARKGPASADLLRRMLIALHVAPETLASEDPAVMRDLQKVCMVCADRKRCERELEGHTAADHFHEFCPNALTLDALLHDIRRGPSQPI